MRISRIHYLATVGLLILLASSVASSRPPAPSPQAPATLDASKMPDIAGLHIGMTAQEAKGVLEKQFNGPARLNPIGFGPGNRQQAVYAIIAGGGPAGSMTADVTVPPNAQLVWHIFRGAAQPNVNRAVLLAALRQKYGKETYATVWDGKAGELATDDSKIRMLVWLMDEQGHPTTGPVKLDAAGNPFGCGFGNQGLGTKPPDYQPTPTFCAQSFVGLSVQFPKGEIITTTSTEMVDYPLAQRSAQATDAYTRAGNQQLQQQQQQKSQEIKPSI
jgi:hypothetical protein